MISLRTPIDPRLSRAPRIRGCLAALVTLALGACATDPQQSGLDPNGIEIKSPEELAAEDAELKARQEDRRQILIGLQRSLESYTLLRSNPSSHRNESELERLRTYLAEVSENRYELLVSVAQDPSQVFLREAAVGALGFSERPEALGILLQAMLDEDPAVRSNAVFGLAIRRDPNTPLKPLMNVVRTEDERVERRAQAAWALYELQTALRDPTLLVPFWQELLQEDDDRTPALVLVQAIRGLGQTRDSEHREAVEAFANHPAPLVRMATAVALGRMRDQRSVPVLLDMMERSNTEPNVLLTIRKALQEFAGNRVDFGEDVEEWRRYFDPGE